MARAPEYGARHPPNDAIEITISAINSESFPRLWMCDMLLESVP
jgi:hypothetical protein